MSAEDASRLRKFVTWCGVSTSIEAIQPFKVEEFLQQQLNTSTPPRTFLPALKAFFTFAQQQGAIESNPMAAVRLPRGSGARKAAPTAATARASRPTPARQAEAVFVSRAQRDSMQTELERMRTEERQKISQMLHEAIKDGDLSENAAYDDAKMRQGMLEARIREVESKLRNAEIIEDQERTGTGVAVGSHVTLKEIAAGNEVTYHVVGPEETNPREGKISHLSPVGRAIIGKSPGDDVIVATPGGSARYKVVSVD
ncbi:MAG: transcription elongation factor GreA [Chloroflexi bacterium]|nr:transcription elongation factor GreA [Chloroflexota bacterium]